MYENEAAEYNREGVVIIRNVMPTELVEECLQAIIAFDKYEPALTSGDAVFDEADGRRHLKYFQHLQMHIPAFRKLYNSRLLAISSALLDQGCYFNAMGLHDKAPGFGTETPMHQDNYYRCLAPPHSVTCYVPLEPQSRVNGGLIYVRKSHLQGVISHEKGMVKAFSSGISGVEFKQEDYFRPELNPGDVAFHHTNIIHGAEENKSDRHRRAVAVSVFGELAQFDKELQQKYEANRKYNRGQV